MKKIIMLSLFISFTWLLFGENTFFNIKNDIISPPMIIKAENQRTIPAWSDFDAIVINKKLIVFLFNRITYKEPVVLTKENVVLNRDGYYTFIYKDTNYILLGGGDLILPIPLPYSDNLEGVPYPPPPNTSLIPLMNVFWFWDDGIEKIAASSYLEEKNKKGQIIKYDETNLRNNFYGIYDAPVYYNCRKLVWSEGVAGPGINEWIDITFRSETDHVMVINGYVNLFRMDLYKANNRIKNARIISYDPEFEILYHFEDIAMFHEIVLPKKTKSVRIVIEDVYKGSRFDDTCISGIYLKQQPGFITHPYYTILDRTSKKYEEILKNSEEDLRRREFSKILNIKN
jgi:hypothetical protein